MMLTAILLLRLSTPISLGPCLTAVSLDPAEGAGASAVFEAVYGHCEGASEFRVVQLWIGDEVTPEVDRLNLGFEAGVFSLENGGTCAPGDAVVLHSPMGALDCSASSVTVAGNQSTVLWAIEFDTTAFAGSRGVYFDAKGGTGDPEPRLGWTQMGTFVVQEDANSTSTTTTPATTTASSDDSISSSEGDGDGDDTSPDTDTATGTGGPDTSIPGGVVQNRGNGSACTCTAGPTPPGWWLLCLLAFGIRGRCGRTRGRSRGRAVATTRR